MENDKYLVFKSDPINTTYDPVKNQYILGGAVERAIYDGVVIRTQDVFAGPGLYAYSAAIQTAIDFIEHRWVGEDITEEEGALRDNLASLRDFFAEQAELATQHPNKKVPD